MRSVDFRLLYTCSAAWLLTALLLISWAGDTGAMRLSRVAKLRKETVEMFYHGYDNYMSIAFPEDEVRLLRKVSFHDRHSPTDDSFDPSLVPREVEIR